MRVWLVILNWFRLGRSPSLLSFRLVLMAPNHKGALEDLLNLIRTDQNSQNKFFITPVTAVSSSSTALRVSRWHQETTRATQQVIGKPMAFPSFFWHLGSHVSHLTFSIGEAFARLDLTIENLERHLRLKSGWASH